MALMRAHSLLPVVRCEAADLNNGTTPPPNPTPSLPFISFSEPSWIVRTESNVRKLRRKKPDPPCVVCSGGGRVDCFPCVGTGRMNYAHLAVLPKGEWPKWCRSCGGSGLISCNRCVGTGKYIARIGFNLMRREVDDIPDRRKKRVRGDQSAPKFPLNVEHQPSNQCPHQD